MEAKEEMARGTTRESRTGEEMEAKGEKARGHKLTAHGTGEEMEAKDEMARGTTRESRTGEEKATDEKARGHKLTAHRTGEEGSRKQPRELNSQQKPICIDSIQTIYTDS